MYQHTIIAGIQVFTPELRTVGTHKVCNFKVTCTTKSSDGRLRTIVMPCTAWGSYAEQAAAIERGRRITVVGDIRQDDRGEELNCEFVQAGSMGRR